MAEEFDANLNKAPQAETISSETTGANAPTEEDKVRLEEEIKRLTEKLNDLEILNQMAEQELKTLKGNISNTENLSKKASNDLLKAQTALNEKNSEIEIKKQSFQTLEKEYTEKRGNLDNLLSEKTKTLSIISGEREKLEKEISSLLECLKKDISTEHESVRKIYEQMIAAAKTQLNSAISESENILKDLRADAQKYAQTRDKQAQEHLNNIKALYEKDEELRKSRMEDFENELREKLDELTEEQQKNVRLRIANELRENSLNASGKGIEDAINKRVEERYKELITEKEQAEKDRDIYATLYEGAKNEFNELSRTIKITEIEKKEAIIEERNQLKELVKTLKKDLADSYLSDDKKEKAEKYDALKEESDKRLDIIQQLSAQVESLKCAEGLNKTVNEIVDRYSDRVEELQEQLNKFKKEDYSQEYRKKPIVNFPVFKEIKEYVTETEELKWIDGIYAGIASEGFKFSKRLIKAFHTCIKTSLWSPITILAGVSGTGKSELPRLYALYGGFHFLNVPVKPDWDSPASMLGYYNALERRFEAKEIIRGMYQMQSDSGLAQSFAIFLLDEMNLSHVELYFSDMLSKLEENRNRKNSDPVCLNIDLGAGVQPLNLKLTHNMVWVGTMNEDETTKSLSDKVVDRSNIIVFPRPKLLVDREFSPSPALQQVLTKDVWKKWANADLCESEEFKDKFKLKTEGYRLIVQEINSKLEQGGRALGHRVWQSIQHYMSAHPDVIDVFKRGADDSEIDRVMGSAFAEAVAFKIMPKLRGIETDGKIRRECLDEIGKIINAKVNELYDDFDLACRSAYGVFMWKSGKFLNKEETSGGDKAENEANGGDKAN